MYEPGSCPKCGGQRKFYYCTGPGYRHSEQGKWNCRHKPEHFHVRCKRCSFRIIDDRAMLDKSQRREEGS